MEVVHSPEEVSVSSPGGLLPTLDPSRLLRSNAARNSLLTRDYLDCDIYTARNRLTRLRQKGLIDFAPDSPRRGPDAVYVKLDKLDDEPPGS